MELLRKMLVKIAPGEVAEYVRGKPTGRYSRVVGWLFETFAGMVGLARCADGRPLGFARFGALGDRTHPEGKRQRVSAVILNRPRKYDEALESFSKPLMERLEYTMDDLQRMTFTNDTADFYRYIDFTELTRITIDFIRETIETELPAELKCPTRYDVMRRGIRDIVELPDPIADLFVRPVRQIGGALSKKKGALPEFAVLTSDEIAAMEGGARRAWEATRFREGQDLTDSGCHSRCAGIPNRE